MLGVESVGFAGLAVLVGFAGWVGLDGLFAFGVVGLLAGVGEGLFAGPFLLGVTFFLDDFEDIDDFLGDFFIFISFILVHCHNHRLLVFDTHRMLQVCFHKLVEPAVEYAVYAAGLIVGTVVLDHLIGVHHVGANLVAPAGVHVFSL